MSLAQRVAGEPARPIKGPPCQVGELLTSIPPKEADALRAMLADRRWTAPQIADALEAEGYQIISQSPIGNHRRGQCLCKRRGIA